MTKLKTILGAYQDIRLSGGRVSGSPNIRENKTLLVFPDILVPGIRCFMHVLIIWSPDSL